MGGGDFGGRAVFASLSAFSFRNVTYMIYNVTDEIY